MMSVGPETALNIIGTNLLSISKIGEVRCLHGAQGIPKDDTQPQLLALWCKLV